MLSPASTKNGSCLNECIVIISSTVACRSKKKKTLERAPFLSRNVETGTRANVNDYDDMLLPKNKT